MNTSTLFDHYVLIRKLSGEYMRIGYLDAFLVLDPNAVPTQFSHITIAFGSIHR